jgi:hypothetical protein
MREEKGKDIEWRVKYFEDERVHGPLLVQSPFFPNAWSSHFRWEIIGQR